MITPEQFFDITKPGSTPAIFRLGAIPASYSGGRPPVVFDGETAASVRTWPYLSSYTPAPHDRVLVAMVGHGGVIVGKIM